MEIKFEKDYLRELFYDGVASDKQHRYQPEIVRRYVRVVNILDSVEKVADLYRYRSLHYEKLLGDKNVFVKPNEQNDACINSAMARKGGCEETNENDKESTGKRYSAHHRVITSGEYGAL